MKTNANTILARSTLFYFQYFLQLTLESIAIFLFTLVLKKDVTRVNNLMNLQMGKVKQIETKNRTYYFYNDMITLKKFETNVWDGIKYEIKTINGCKGND